VGPDGDGAEERDVTATDQQQPEEQEHETAQAEQRQAMFRLLLVLMAGVFAAYAIGIAKAVAVVFAVIVMIMIHELGHFLTAKSAGMKVTEYFLGFGPRLWSVRKGETEYGVKALPLGGYVKIVGMHNLDEVDPVDEPRTYRQKSYPRRLSVAVAGSFMHLVMAFLLLWTLHSVVGFVQPDNRIGEISKLPTGQSPAQEAGFRPGDKIVSIDGRPLRKWDDLPPYIQDHPGDAVTFVVERAGQQLTLVATPIDRSKLKLEGDSRTFDKPTGFIGISPHLQVVKDGPVQSLGKSAGDIGALTKQTFGFFGNLFSFHGLKEYGQQLTAQPGDTKPAEDQPRLLSPVGLARIANQVANNGIRDVLVLLISINVFVGILNMFPMLPFDGGHVAIATYEAIVSKIKKRRHFVDVTKLLPFTYMVFLVLMFLAVTSLYLDIARPLNLQ
jgi:membrane-associated protease RseP (regulator of RpoE activity)